MPIKCLPPIKICDIENNNKSIKKYIKLLKIRKLSKSGNSKSKKLFKSRKLAELDKKLSKNKNLS